MEASELRVALFSGNYNYVRDGANQALNRLVGYLERQGVAVRVYAPTTDTPAFPPTGTLISIPSFEMPFGRGEYRIGWGLNRKLRADLKAFAPSLVHISAPDIVGNSAVAWARRNGIPAVASVHTRFETYFRYYGMAWAQVAAEAWLRRLYFRCAEIYAPSESMAAVLTDQRMSRRVGIWSRGIDREQFNPERRDMDWRRAQGIADDEAVILFVARLVMEKGLDVLAAALSELRARGVPHRVLIVGDGPARGWIAERVPDAIFTGMISGAELARAYASADIMFNPSSTETFGNVTLEAMASGLPVVGARAAGSLSLIDDGVTGLLTIPNDVEGSADALAHLIGDIEFRGLAGLSGVQRARRFDWDAINGRLLARYLRVCEVFARAQRLRA